jgi:hypothetical protein
VIAAAQAATERMYSEFGTASNGESRICATDAIGNPRWSQEPPCEVGLGKGTTSVVRDKQLKLVRFGA